MINENTNNNEKLANPNTEISNSEAFNFDSYFELHPEKKNPKFISFLTWFVGYFEGNSALIIYKDRESPYAKRPLVEIFSRKSAILEYINKELNLEGQLHAMNHKKSSKITFYIRISSKENLNKLLRILNGNCQISKTYEFIEPWFKTANIYNIPEIKLLPQKNKISLNNAWLSGFIDADGTFLACLYKHKTAKSGFALKSICAIAKQNNFYLLDTIRKIFNSKTKISNLSDKRNYFRFQIQNISSFDILLKYLKKFPLRTIDKLVSYENWKKLLKYNFQKNLYPIVQNETKFLKLKKQIRELNSHSIRSKFYKKELNKEKIE